LIRKKSGYDMYTFKAVIKSADRGGAFVAVPFDLKQAFGKKRVKVKATSDGGVGAGKESVMSAPPKSLFGLNNE